MLTFGGFSGLLGANESSFHSMWAGADVSETTLAMDGLFESELAENPQS